MLPEETHNLLKLFEEFYTTLSDGTKRRIGELECQHKINLEQIFEKHQSDFVKWRYGYEQAIDETTMKDLDEALGLLEALFVERLRSPPNP